MNNKQKVYVKIPTFRNFCNWNDDFDNSMNGAMPMLRLTWNGYGQGSSRYESWLKWMQRSGRKP